MSQPIRPSDLESYLDEALSGPEMARIEQRLRADPRLREQLAAINARRDTGMHSLGEIWRRHRVSCPSREQLGSFLLGAMPAETAAYVAFHLEVVACRYCQANLDDLKGRKSEPAQAAESRRRKYFQSSAGYLRRER